MVDRIRLDYSGGSDSLDSLLEFRIEDNMRCSYCNSDKEIKLRLELFGKKMNIKHFCSIDCLKSWLRFNA